MTGLPSSYHVDKVVLMRRDPTSAHIYWDINGAALKEITGASGTVALTLRLVDAETRRPLLEVPVLATSGSRDVDLSPSADSYVAEVLAVSSSREWLLARSSTLGRTHGSRPVAQLPVFATRSEQRSAVIAGRSLDSMASGSGQLATSVAGAVDRGRALPAGASATLDFVDETAIWFWRPSGMGSEARLLGIGSEVRLRAGWARGAV